MKIRYWILILSCLLLFGLIMVLPSADDTTDKNDCLDLCLGEDTSPYMRSECKKFCQELNYYFEDDEIKEILDGLK